VPCFSRTQSLRFAFENKFIGRDLDQNLLTVEFKTVIFILGSLQCAYKTLERYGVVSTANHFNFLTK